MPERDQVKAQKVSIFDVLKTMCNRNMDVRVCYLPENFVNAKKVKAGGHVTIGVDAGTVDRLMLMALDATRDEKIKTFGMFLMIDVSGYDLVKSELEKGVKGNESVPSAS